MPGVRRLPLSDAMVIVKVKVKLKLCPSDKVKVKFKVQPFGHEGQTWHTFSTP